MISIIMAAYNAEKYINQAISSLLKQSYRDWELIVIDDGSKDNTADIVKEYTKREELRIIFESKKNEGVSITRNKALNMAKGEYIMFLDADDVLFDDALEETVRTLIETDADFLKYEYKTIDENSHYLYPNYGLRNRKRFIGQLLTVEQMMDNVMQGEYFLCMHIFKSSIIKEDGIHFLEGCTYNEDTLFIVQYLQHANRCAYSPVVLYGYRKYTDAVTAKFTNKNYDDVKLVFEQLMAMTKQKLLQTQIMGVAQTLACRLVVERKERDIRPLIEQCVSCPVIIEWRLFTIFGFAALPLWKVVKIWRRCKRKIAI